MKPNVTSSRAIAQVPRLSAIRPYLTHNLTLQEAHMIFGKPVNSYQSGHLYRIWLLDDGDRLSAVFSNEGGFGFDRGRLLSATVKNPKGEVIERVLEDPDH